ncbi:hypothetical protein GN244_ATG01310 [Phytophthora infestans]|uniref:Uncharacterized protein n=1 Tax=Phytophthora infestans TaxID=4787 RepID=A0A833T2F6_PHYIN|nr:hypothetical protein GN244_ATG01310 [Phytophthora infestans]
MELAVLGAFDTPERLVIHNIRFNARTYGSASAELGFRFTIEGVRSLARLFRLMETVITEDGDRCMKEEVTAIMLNQLSPFNVSMACRAGLAARRDRFAEYFCG